MEVVFYFPASMSNPTMSRWPTTYKGEVIYSNKFSVSSFTVGLLLSQVIQKKGILNFLTFKHNNLANSWKIPLNSAYEELNQYEFFFNEVTSST